jgi:nitroreductase
MKRTKSLFWLVLIIISFSLVSAAQEPKPVQLPPPQTTVSADQGLKPVQLPPPQTTGGRPLMDVLKDRQTTRNFEPGPQFTPQQLSNLLWAAYGINRPDGKRTVPSSNNRQQIIIYVVTQNGAYWYDAKANMLNMVLAGDIRPATGTQPGAKNATVNLVYVTDLTKTKKGAPVPSEPDLADGIGVGVIAQDVYLYAASEGLDAWFRMGGVDKTVLSKELKLPPTQAIIGAQSVGIRKK